MAALQLLCAAALLLAVTVAEVVVHRQCPDVPPDACTIAEVRIEPCSNPRICRLKKGNPASIKFDFTPNFSAPKLKTGLFWASPNGDMPFPDLYEADGCQLTACPTDSGKSQELNYNLNLNKKLPSGTFDFKWKLWNEDDVNQVCCFITTVQMRK